MLHALWRGLARLGRAWVGLSWLDLRAESVLVCLAFPMLGWASFQKSGARARGLFFIFYFFPSAGHTMARKKKVAAGQSGARADPNQYITVRSPYPIHVGRDPLPRAKPPNQDIDPALPQVSVGRGQEGPSSLP